VNYSHKLTESDAKITEYMPGVEELLFYSTLRSGCGATNHQVSIIKTALLAHRRGGGTLQSSWTRTPKNPVERCLTAH